MHIRKRFMTTSRCLHFSWSNDDISIDKIQCGYNPIPRMKWSVNEYNSFCGEFWYQEQNLIVDE